ncbi:MAG: hypothetical protein AAF065_13205 [Verrucomicrobiota bacterium]
MGQEGDRQKQRLEQVQAVQMGNLDEEALSFSGMSGLDRRRSDNLDRKKKDGFDLLIQLNEVNEYLAKLDAMIAEIQARIDELLVERQTAELAAQEAFDRMHELEDLLSNIHDGISADESKRLTDLLGVDPKTIRIEELTILLEEEIRSSRQTGLDMTDEAEKLKTEIEMERDAIKALKDQREDYENANTPEERQIIETALSGRYSQDEADFHEEVTFGAVPLPP